MHFCQTQWFLPSFSISVGHGRLENPSYWHTRIINIITSCCLSEFQACGLDKKTSIGRCYASNLRKSTQYKALMQDIAFHSTKLNLSFIFHFSVLLPGAPKLIPTESSEEGKIVQHFLEKFKPIVVVRLTYGPMIHRELAQNMRVPGFIQRHLISNY